MRRSLFVALTLLLISVGTTYAQVSETIIVKGDPDKFYPVVFQDKGWPENVATELQIGRSNVHVDVPNMPWQGSLIAKFRIHTTRWGNGSNFIDADIKQYFSQFRPLIAGWYDATGANGSHNVIIWLRGGNLPYYCKSQYGAEPVVFDGVQNALPFKEQIGDVSFKEHTYKTALDPNVPAQGGAVYRFGADFGGVVKTNDFFQNNGLVLHGFQGYYADISNNLYWENGWKYMAAGPANLFKVGEHNIKSDYTFYTAPVGTTPGATANLLEAMRICENGNVGIGTSTPGTFKLAVEGVLGARRIKVQQTPWADFVFKPGYQLPSLDSVAKFIATHQHLPEIPSEKEVQEQGIDVGDMNKKLLQKIEELTLYLIDQQKEYRSMFESLKKENQDLKEQLSRKK